MCSKRLSVRVLDPDFETGVLGGEHFVRMEFRISRIHLDAGISPLDVEESSVGEVDLLIIIPHKALLREALTSATQGSLYMNLDVRRGDNRANLRLHRVTRITDHRKQHDFPNLSLFGSHESSSGCLRKQLLLLSNYINFVNPLFLVPLRSFKLFRFTCPARLACLACFTCFPGLANYRLSCYTPSTKNNK